MHSGKCDVCSRPRGFSGPPLTTGCLTSEKLPDHSGKQSGCAIPCESACEVPDARNHSEWSKEKKQHKCSKWMGGNKTRDAEDEAFGVGET